MPSWPEPYEVFTLFKVDHNLTFTIAEKEKHIGRVLKGHLPYKSEFYYFGNFLTKFILNTAEVPIH